MWSLVDSVEVRSLYSGWLLYFSDCSIINKNPETDIEVQPEGQLQNSQSLALTSTSVWNGDSASKNLRMRFCVTAVSSCLIVLSSTGIKACTTTIQFLWQTSVTTGIKGVYHHCLVCKTDQWGCFTPWSSAKLYLLKYKWNAIISNFFNSGFLLLRSIRIHTTV